MIHLALEALGATFLTGAAGRAWIGSARRRVVRQARERYAKCLANIPALERELFPDWFPVVEPAKQTVQQAVMVMRSPYSFGDLDFSPGSRWVVDSPGAISATSYMPSSPVITVHGLVSMLHRRVSDVRELLALQGISIDRKMDTVRVSDLRPLGLARHDGGQAGRGYSIH